MISAGTTLGHSMTSRFVLFALQLFEAAAKLGVCANTRFRFATPADAPILHTLNRVNDAFVCWQVRLEGIGKCVSLFDGRRTRFAGLRGNNRSQE